MNERNAKANKDMQKVEPRGWIVGRLLDTENCSMLVRNMNADLTILFLTEMLLLL